jgi:hypothetical protein
MYTLPSLRLTALATACLAGIACASAGTSIHRYEMNVQINNNLNVPTELTIFAVSPAGSRKLGTIAPRDSALLTWVPPDKGVTYRFVAERAGERPIRSQPFSVSGKKVGTITWALIPNVLVFSQSDMIDTVNVDSAGVR